MVLVGRSWPFVLVVCLAWLCVGLPFRDANAQGDRVQSVVTSKAFAKRFHDYFERTARRPIGQLNAYLESAVEDVFLDASQLSPTPLTAEVRHFQDVLLEDLQDQLCRGRPPALPQVEDLKLVIVRSISKAARASSVDVKAGSYGRIAGIVANIVEQTAGHGLCQNRSFSDLE